MAGREDLHADVLEVALHLLDGGGALLALVDLAHDGRDDHDEEKDSGGRGRNPLAEDEQHAQDDPEDGRADALLVGGVLGVAHAGVDGDEADEDVHDLQELVGERHVGAREELDEGVHYLSPSIESCSEW